MIKCLDHGFVRLVDHMGSDSSVVQAARVSYGDGTKTVSEDRDLIRFMMRHDHATPLESPVFRFHAKMPIFVARQWVRHRTATINEVSARYSVLPAETYVPEKGQVQLQSKTNKQGRAEAADEYLRDLFVRDCTDTGLRLFDQYNTHLEEDVARELARINLPLSTYTEWYWQCNLRNLLHFLSLRCDSHAQYEIRVYADAMRELIKPIVPLCIEAWEDYDKRRGGLLLSALDLKALRGEGTDGMSKRERVEYQEKKRRMAL